MATTVNIERCRAYLLSQLGSSGKVKQPRPFTRPAVAISRATGAGALTLAEELADRLNSSRAKDTPSWTVFDKHLVKQVLEDHQLPARLEQYMPEDAPKLVDETLGEMLGLHPPTWRLVQLTADTIYRLASMGHCIIVGRGSTLVTRKLPNVLRIRLVGSLEKRVKHVMDYFNMDESEARAFIKKQDRARKRYVMAHYDADIDDPINYHMVINVDDIPHDLLLSQLTALIRALEERLDAQREKEEGET